MEQPVFLFDLDSTVTKAELLPFVAQKTGCCPQMQALTEQAMMGQIPFEQSFAARVALLAHLPVARVRSLAAQLPLNRQVVSFIARHRQRCWIATGNLDLWVEALAERLGMQGRCYCSAARLEDGRVAGVKTFLDKKALVRRFDRPVVAVGDGDNDAGMIEAAAVGIGFGGVRPIAPAVLRVADYAVYTQEELCTLLERFV